MAFDIKSPKIIGAPKPVPIPMTPVPKGNNSREPTTRRGLKKTTSQPKKKSKFYSTGPVVPSNKIADKPSMPTPAIGTELPGTIPQGPVSRFGENAPHRISRPSSGGSHGFGHSAVNRLGPTRLSGNPLSHRIGKR